MGEQVAAAASQRSQLGKIANAWRESGTRDHRASSLSLAGISHMRFFSSNSSTRQPQLAGPHMVKCDQLERVAHRPPFLAS